MTRPGAGAVRAWFPDEIAALLSGVALAIDAVTSDMSTPQLEIYRRGVNDTLRALAAVVQVDAPSVGGRREVTR